MANIVDRAVFAQSRRSTSSRGIVVAQDGKKKDIKTNIKINEIDELEIAMDLLFGE